MKMRAVSVVVWFAQLLTACALHDNPMTTDDLDEVRSQNSQLVTERATTNQQFRITTTWTVTPPVTTETITSSPSTEELPAKWIQTITSTTQPTVTRLNKTEAERSSPSLVGTETVRNTISTADHTAMNPEQTDPLSLTEENRNYPETRTRSSVSIMGLTSQNRVHTKHAMDVNNWESETPPPTAYTVHTTSSRNVTDERKEGTWSTSESTMSLSKSVSESAVAQSEGSNTSTMSQQLPAHNTATYDTRRITLDTQTENHTSIGNITVNPSSEYGTDGEVTTATTTTQTGVNTTQVTPNYSKDTPPRNTEGTSVFSTHSKPVSSVSPDNGTQENINTTQSAIWTVGVSTQSSEESYNFTTEKWSHSTADYNTTQRELTTHTRNQTNPDNSTAGHVRAVHLTTRGLNFTMSATQATVFDGNTTHMAKTEGRLVSSTSPNTVSATSLKAGTNQDRLYWTENVTTTQRSYSSVGTEGSVTHSASVWSTFSVNVFTSNSTETAIERNRTRVDERPLWTDCFHKASSSPQRSSKMVCFFILWSLAMFASIFLGLTICLWVRLSVVKKRARQRRRNGRRSAGKERECLWAINKTPEERVEFWYANGSTLEADKAPQDRERRERIRKRAGKQKEGMEDVLWMQPRVTVHDISEFWYANGRERNERLERHIEISGPTSV